MFAGQQSGGGQASGQAAGGALGTGGALSPTGGVSSASGGTPNASGGVMSASGGTSSAGGAPGSGGTSNNSGGSTGGAGTSTPAGKPYVFIGTTEGMLRAYEMNTSDGSLTPAGSQAAPGLDFMTVDATTHIAFVSGNNQLSAYKYDPAGKSFSLIGSKASTQGTHVAVHPNGKYVFVAGYNPGEMFFHTFSEQAGFGAGQSYSPGANAHSVRIAPSGTAVYVPCLGSDHVALYTLDPVNGVLTSNGTASVDADSGPRHMDFHPTANVAYVLAELSSQIYVFDINVQTGGLQARPTDTIFTSDDHMFHQSSDIRVTPDGAHVYAVNRQPSEIVRFKVEANFSLTKLGADSLSGEVRAFGVDKSGKFLQVGSKDGKLVAFMINAETGALSPTATLDGLGKINVTEVHYLE